MNTYEMTTWIDGDLIDRERLDATSEPEARSFARGVATERIRHNPAALARLGVKYCVHLHSRDSLPTLRPKALLGDWYFVGDTPGGRVGWKPIP